MPYIDIARLDENITYHLDSPTMIETVRGNMEGFTLEDKSTEPNRLDLQ
jgi:hypothetical protein